MAGLGRNYPSVGKGRSNSNGYGGMLAELNWSDEIT